MSSSSTATSHSKKGRIIMVYLVSLVLIYFGFRMNFYVGLVVLLLALGLIAYKSLPSIYATLGNKAYHAGDNDGVKKYYNKALATDRAPVSSYSTYVLMLMRMGELDKALEIANLAIINRKFAERDKYVLKEYRALIYYHKGEAEEALEDAREIFDNYKNTTIYSLLGFLMLACDEPIDETLAFCLEAYDYNSDDRDVVDNLLLAYYKNGDLDKASELADELLEMSPTFIEAQYHSALIAKAKGDIEKAKEHIENLDDCIRTALTTVSEEEIEEFSKSLEN